MFTMRFDMRAPEGDVPTTERYATAVEMCAWAEARGCVAAIACEHHAVEDGYLPAPLIMASAIAARTRTLPITLAAVILPFYDPVRLAEDIAVLDLVSDGRISYVFGLGYRPEEYEHFGVDMADRGRIADEHLALVLRLLRGETVTIGRRRIHVTPHPRTPGGPPIMWGGGSLAAARRAGRFGLGLLAQGSVPGMQEAYDAACRENGHEPLFTVLPERDAPVTCFVARDVDAAWEELGTYLLHDARSYAAWNRGNTTTAGVSTAETVDELRVAHASHRILGLGEAEDQVRRGEVLLLSPLCGGLPPDVAWRYLEVAADVAATVRGPDAAPPTAPGSPAPGSPGRSPAP